MAHKAKQLAAKVVEGSFKDQYRRIYDYAHEIIRSNPGSTMKVKVEDVNDENIFMRIYTSLKACKDNFVSTYAVVEVENEDTWSWFLELLVEDLGGLLPAIQELLLGAEQRFCMRHLYKNYRKKFGSKQLKTLMWKATTGTYPRAWEREMHNIEEVNEEAFKYLIAIPPSWSGQKLFEVRHVSLIGDKFTVNIEIQECSCRKWLISEIPCCHAIIAMNFLNLKAEDYIPHWFRRTTYEEIYNSIVLPANGHLFWETNAFPDVLPPLKRRLPGRPKKKRRLEDWKLKKDNTQIRLGGHRKRCSVCRALGHKRNNYPALPVHGCEERPTEAVAPQPTQPTPSEPPPSQPSAAPTPPATTTPPTTITPPIATTPLAALLPPNTAV
ncbi:uncharacterized protein LOC114189806 [Vigna unguiculata]|uniref:uncharacterized protein LOC114189806 n=1 Tax=Vigna unguiculata TaxID=3917 RepID=UPI001016A30F|nr:uncharacterized protein LOC114189806 [Vigna unguiculata]